MGDLTPPATATQRATGHGNKVSLLPAASPSGPDIQSLRRLHGSLGVLNTGIGAKPSRDARWSTTTVAGGGLLWDQHCLKGFSKHRLVFLPSILSVKGAINKNVYPLHRTDLRISTVNLEKL